MPALFDDASARPRAESPRRRPTFPAAAFVDLLRRAARAARADGETFDPDRLDRRDPALVASLEAPLRELNRRWLSLSVDGAAHLRVGPCLYVGNHNGGIMGPDLFCTMQTLWSTLGADAPLYAMAHDFAMRRVRPLGRMLQRIGGVRATPANAQRVLAAGGSVLVYPGGDLDAFRHFRDRHRIAFGRRTGFVRLAREANVPIVPIVAAGAHQSAIIFHEGEWLAQALGLKRWSRLQRFPLALALPWGVAPGPWMPYLPLPFPIRLRVLPAITVAADRSLEDARDDVVSRMQAALDDMTRHPPPGAG